jgi:hypothetical protein
LRPGALAPCQEGKATTPAKVNNAAAVDTEIMRAMRPVSAPKRSASKDAWSALGKAASGTNTVSEDLSGNTLRQHAEYGAAHLCVGHCANTATPQPRAANVGKASLHISAAAFIHSLGQLQLLRLCKSSPLAHRAQRAWARSKWHRAFHHPRGGGIRTRSVRFAV